MDFSFSYPNFALACGGLAGLAGYIIYKNNYGNLIVSKGIDAYVDLKHYIGFHVKEQDIEITTHQINGIEVRHINNFICWDKDVEITKSWNSDLIGFEIRNSNTLLSDEEELLLTTYLSRLAGPDGNLIPPLDILRAFMPNLPPDLVLTVENEIFEEFTLKTAYPHSE